MNFKSLVEDMNEFAVKLISSDQAPGNLVMSPLSAWTVLCLTAQGAHGTTQDEIVGTILHSQPDSATISEKYHDLAGQIITKDLLTANAIFLHPSIELDPDFNNKASAMYNAKVSKLATDARQSCADINNFVANQTNGKIHDIVDERIIRADVRCLLINTMYFNNKWATAFDKNGTKNLPFNVSNNTTVNVPMMTVEAPFKYNATDDYKVIELPYADNQYSMTIIIPTRSMEQVMGLMARGDASMLASMSAESKQTIGLTIPRFSISWNSDLSSNLQSLGIKTAFTKDADFTGISKDGSIALNGVIHKAIVEVGEEGTEAGAGAIGKLISKAIATNTTLTIDRPFLFCIKHVDTNVAVFFGRIDDPSKTQ